MDWNLVIRIIVIIILATPVAWVITWITPLPGIGGYASWRHFRLMEQMYQLEKRARKLNKGQLTPDPKSESDAFFARCSEVEMLQELLEVSRTYSGAYLVSERLWGELRYLRAGKPYEIDSDGSVRRRYTSQWTDQQEYLEKTGKYSRSNVPIQFEEEADTEEEAATNVIELEPTPPPAGTKAP